MLEQIDFPLSVSAMNPKATSSTSGKPISHPTNYYGWLILIGLLGIMYWGWITIKKMFDTDELVSGLNKLALT